MDSTVPADLLKLKDRLDAWRATRKYARQPIPDEFRQAAADMAGRYSPSLVRRILKLDPWQLNKRATKKPDRARHKPKTAFFTLPSETPLLLPGSSATQDLAGCRLQIERPDGARLTLMLPFEAAVSDKLNVNLIRDTWDEMLRLAASLKYGDEKASLIVGKLAAASHRNRLFRGLQELGRLVKTAYLAEYFGDVELRRRVLLGLNKGESLHSLARKVFFGSLGEVRDRTYEDQLNAASSLNLLLAAIVCWNTVHLQACIKKLRADGVEAKEEDLRFLSPLLRHHIGIYGQYSFDFRRYDEIPSPEELSY